MSFWNRFLKWFFFFLRKVFYFKIKGINLGKNKIPNKTKMKPQSKIFLVINKNDNGDGRGQSSWFSNGL